jgi:hypothetical protein
MEKEKCNRCGELREFIDKNGLCIFCKRELNNCEVEGTIVKVQNIENSRGTTINAKEGIKDNSWMRR